jgi:peptidoglycan/LPS O-acetylase OafA/YrhL
MPTTETRHHRPPRSSTVRARPRRDRVRVVWAATLTILLGVLFTGLTALTVALWATDPAYVETNPVVDLAFFALGGVLVTGGFASQITRRPPVAGLQQAVLALTALTAAGWLGGRIEPAIGGLVLLLATVPLVVLHPDRRQLTSMARRQPRPDGPGGARRGSGRRVRLRAADPGPVGRCVVLPGPVRPR